MILGGCPSAGITVGAARTLAMTERYLQISSNAIRFIPRSLTMLLRLGSHRRVNIETF
jgi:hypothetical protein